VAGHPLDRHAGTGRNLLAERYHRCPITRTWPCGNGHEKVFQPHPRTAATTGPMICAGELIVVGHLTKRGCGCNSINANHGPVKNGQPGTIPLHLR